MDIIKSGITHAFGLASLGLAMSGGFELLAPESFGEFTERGSAGSRGSAAVQLMSMISQFDPVTNIVIGSLGTVLALKAMDDDKPKLKERKPFFA